jgi:hypothetical protein
MKMKKFSVLAIIALAMTSFFACQKDVSNNGIPEIAGAKGGGGGSAPPPAFIFNLPTFGVACVTDGTYCFDASFTNKGGNDPGGNNSITVSLWQLGVQIGTDQVVYATSGNFCFDLTSLLPGQYTVLVYFRHAGSDNAQPVNVPLSFTLTVQSTGTCGETSTCSADGVSLTRSLTNVETDINGIVTSLQTNYIVRNCGANDLTRLKLQGGLINKASIITSGWTGDATNVNPKISTSNGNNVLTWTFNLAAGKTATFSVYYSAWGVGCGSPLSGAWSLKNSAGVPIGVSPEDMSAVSAGYLDRLYWNCP